MYLANEVSMVERKEGRERESERRAGEEARRTKEREERSHETDQYNLPFTD